MRKEAVVLEIREKEAVVLASDGRFLRVRNQGYQVGQRIPEAEQTPIRPRAVLRRTLLIAACFVLVLGSSALAASKYMVWSYAGMDVGDLSVNYALNFRNEVLNAEGNSTEAEQLIESLEKIPYEPVDSAVERMMDAADESQPEEAETPEVVISVASFMGGTERTEERIKEGIHRYMEKARPDEPGEKHEEEIRVERLEWKDAGQIMEERHRPQNTQMPADAGENRQPPEETKPEAAPQGTPEAAPKADEPPANSPEAAPQGTAEHPSKTDEPPAQKPETNMEKQELPVAEKQESPALKQENPVQEKQENPAPEQKPSGQEQQGNSPGAENAADRPAENDTGPMQEKRIPEEANGQQMQPAIENGPGQQPAERPPENGMNEPGAPGGMQNPPGAGGR